MAIAFLQEFEIKDGDTSTTNYDAIAAKLGRTPPPGLIVHTAGFDTDAGVFRIFAVWENGDAAKSFFEGTLEPILEEARSQASDPGKFTPPDRETTYELHDELH